MKSKEVIVTLVSGKIRVYPVGLGGFKKVPSYVTTWEQYHADKRAEAEEQQRLRLIGQELLVEMLEAFNQ